jgi:heme/copper-type cytochrome/quinol oxidase subunit 4
MGRQEKADLVGFIVGVGLALIAFVTAVTVTLLIPH